MVEPTRDAAAPTLGSRFLREAGALSAAEIVPLRADAALAEKNVAVGVAAVLAYDAHVAEHLPSVDLAELRSLPDLARAVVVAAHEAGGDEELGPLYAEACTLRRTLRAVAVGLVEAGVLGARDLARFSPERGATDVGADCAALASLFQRKAEELEGKSAAGEEDLARAAEVGLALRAHFKPTGAARKPGASGLSPAEGRDRLWTLLLLRHERLWAVGAYIYGHAVDAHVPALHAAAPRSRPKGKAAASAATPDERG